VLFLAEKSIQKQLLNFTKELSTFRFTSQKPLINVEFHAFFLSAPFHYAEEHNSAPFTA